MHLAQQKPKLTSFAAGAGSILYFEDTDIVKRASRAVPLYAENFPVWSEQASGMAQLSVWTALAAENVGASLQHYNPIIDDEVHATWGYSSPLEIKSTNGLLALSNKKQVRKIILKMTLVLKSSNNRL